ncbi:uncharacterized protein LOC142504980 [Primulina tabacum]|uniref:uncharacterized protein LOC142504980 n=1 Tax=Primulina tabacum TaxID=48773 RepID=UPI003F59CFEC
MNSLIWNVRGHRSSESQQRLHALVKAHQIKILAILEPMVQLDRRFMTRRFGFSKVISNLSGHIWVFLSADVMAECVSDHAQFLHIKVSAPFLPTTVFCSFVYASCDYIERWDLWHFLLLVRPVQGPWLVGGDFNVVRDASECLGTHGGRLLPMDEFNTFILDSGLVDAGFEGSIRVEHLARSVSDHCPLLTVRLNWNLPCNLSGLHRLFAKMKRLKDHLKWWNRDVFGNIFDKITEAERVVRSAEAVCEADPSDLNWTSLSDRNEDLARVTAMEVDFWRQKAACHWLEDGERNTKLFHNMVKKKRVTNKIFRIWHDGFCLTSPELIQQSGASFFQNLLTREPSALDCPDFSRFPFIISAVENDGIVATPSLEEVRATVFSIHPDSVAGPDGFSSAFLQNCWEIVHQDVYDAVLDFFRGSPLPTGFTATTITLIPKVEVAHAWSDFRPISLCNVSNKIISKLLYSRLRVVVERLISLNQSGFVLGRLISDNILLAQELTHSLTLPTHGGNVILKFDMAKAYDRVQWPFLFEVLRHFGFSEWVVEMVSACISHCHFSVNINGSLSGFFGSTRGLRQGDPLSPLLFILGAEYLSRGLERLYLQHPALRYRSGCDILISHLAYADDVIIFANGGSRGLKLLMDFLHHYKNCSRQLVNAVKSSVILPPRCSAHLRSQILRITRFAEGHLPLKYLGVPLFRGNRVCSLFEPLLQAVRMKLEGWEIRTLSPGSRMTLIRSVLLSMPIYLFQVVQPSLAVMEKLELIFNAFLWGSRPLEKKWHWARWSRACLPVLEGGLGFRKLKDLLDAPACVPLLCHISPTWRRLLRIRPRAESCFRWRVGLGDVSFWDDILFGDTPLSSQCEVRGGRDVRVSHFLSEEAWDFDLLCAVVAPSVAEAITLTPIAFGEPDMAIWIHSSYGAFSLRSAWELVRLRDPVSDILTPCSGRWLRPTMSFFLWRLRHQWLPVDDVLQRRGFHLASRCQCCDMSETFIHIFIDGPIARTVWHFFGAIFRVQIPCTGDLRLFLSVWKRNLHWAPGGHVKEFLPFIVLWFLWTARNDAKHRQLHISGETVKSQILSYLRLAQAAFIVKPKHWLGVSEAGRSLGFFVGFQRSNRIAIIRWLCSPPGCFKLNVDGSSRGNPWESSVGGVVRDSAGQVVLSFSEFIGVGTNVRAELWAVWRGLLIYSDLGLFPLWVETDSQISLQILRSRRCHWDLHHTVTRILVLLRERAAHLSHIFREGNSVADALAARAHTLRVLYPWGIAFSPVLLVECEWVQTLASSVFCCFGPGWVPAPSLLVLLFVSPLFSGGRSLQASPCPPTFPFDLPSVVVAQDDLYLWPLSLSSWVLELLWFELDCGLILVLRLVLSSDFPADYYFDCGIMYC